MTQTQEEHGVLPPEHPPEKRHKPTTSICHIRLLSSIIYTKESDILRSKPNVVSVCGGAYRSLFSRKIAVMRSSLVAYLSI